MKTFPNASSQSMTGPRKKRLHQPLSREMHQIAHHLFNQLSVINLCTFKVQARSRGAGDQAVSDDLKLLQRAVEEATHWAEQLSHIISQAAPPTEGKNPRPSKLRNKLTRSSRFLPRNTGTAR
jgi:hypothetical protein